MWIRSVFQLIKVGKSSFYPLILNDQLNGHLDATEEVLNKKVVSNFNLVKYLLKGILNCFWNNTFLKG